MIYMWWFLLLLLPVLVFGADVRVGRYLSTTSAPKASQQNPLEQIFSLTFPNSINTIGQAMDYILNNTSYKLMPNEYRSEDIASLLGQQLPLSDRQIGPISVDQALHVLAGSSYQMLIDPKHRYISFILKPTFNNLYPIR